MFVQQYFGGKALSNKYSDTMKLAQLLSTQCPCAVLSSGACPALHYFPLYFIKRKSFEKKLFNINICCDFIYKVPLKYIYCFSTTTIVTRTHHNIMNARKLRVVLHFFIRLLSEESDCHEISAVYVHHFSTKKISEFYNLFKIVHRLPTANAVHQETFKF